MILILLLNLKITCIQLKKVSGKPLEQIANRMIEKRNTEKNFSNPSKDFPIIYYNKNKTKVNKVEFDGFILSSKNGNNCCVLSNSIIATVNDIYLKNNVLYFRKQHLSIEPFFTSPCDSTLVGIYKLSDSEADLYATVTADQISRKCLKADDVSSDDNSSIVFSLLH